MNIPLYSHYTDILWDEIEILKEDKRPEPFRIQNLH